MLWNYLAQFWQQISDVVVGGITYTADFFRNIGNAVAGALGQFFDVIFHNLNDIIVFFGWFFSNVKAIFLFLLSPVSYFFTFLKTFISALGQTPSSPAISYAFSSDTLAVFDTIPHFDTFRVVLGAIIVFLGGVAILKLLLRT